MPKSETFRLNHYVGTMLAQGGNLWFDDVKIVFSPTSAIDRALGATDEEILFPQIQGVEFKGDLARSFIVKTEERLHRFHGSQAKRAWQALATTLQEKGMKPMPKPQPKTTCDHCSGRLEPAFLFCPYCGTRVTSD